MVFVITKSSWEDYHGEECGQLVEDKEIEAIRTTKELAEQFVKEQMGLYDFWAKKVNLENDLLGRKKELDAYNIQEVSDFK